MAKLLGKEVFGDKTEYYWLHTGDDGKDRITVQTVQDVEPVIKQVKAQSATPGRDFRLKARIPATLVSDAARISAGRWGVSPREAFAEIVKSKTDRAKKVWKLLTEGRDLNKLHTKTYR